MSFRNNFDGLLQCALECNSAKSIFVPKCSPMSCIAISINLYILYVLAPIFQEKFFVSENLHGNKSASDSIIRKLLYIYTLYIYGPCLTYRVFAEAHLFISSED